MRRRLALFVVLVATASCLPVGGQPPSLPLAPSAAVSSAHDLVESSWGIDVTRQHPVRTARPRPVAPRPTARPAAPPRRPRPPITHHARPKPLAMVPTGGAVVCYVGRPCVIPATAWHVTHGCTGAWRRATHQDCPPGYPRLP